VILKALDMHYKFVMGLFPGFTGPGSRSELKYGILQDSAGRLKWAFGGVGCHIHTCVIQTTHSWPSTVPWIYFHHRCSYHHAPAIHEYGTGYSGDIGLRGGSGEYNGAN